MLYSCIRTENIAVPILPAKRLCSALVRYEDPVRASAALARFTYPYHLLPRPQKHLRPLPFRSRIVIFLHACFGEGCQHPRIIRHLGKTTNPLTDMVGEIYRFCRICSFLLTKLKSGVGIFYLQRESRCGTVDDWPVFVQSINTQTIKLNLRTSVMVVRMEDFLSVEMDWTCLAPLECFSFASFESLTHTLLWIVRNPPVWALCLKAG